MNCRQRRIRLRLYRALVPAGIVCTFLGILVALLANTAGSTDHTQLWTGAGVFAFGIVLEVIAAFIDTRTPAERSAGGFSLADQAGRCLQSEPSDRVQSEKLLNRS